MTNDTMAHSYTRKMLASSKDAILQAKRCPTCNARRLHLCTAPNGHSIESVVHASRRGLIKITQPGKQVTVKITNGKVSIVDAS